MNNLILIITKNEENKNKDIYTIILSKIKNIITNFLLKKTNIIFYKNYINLIYKHIKENTQIFGIYKLTEDKRKAMEVYNRHLDERFIKNNPIVQVGGLKKIYKYVLIKD